MKPVLFSLLGVLFAVISTVGAVQADAQVRATVDRTRISVGESIQLQVAVSGGAGEVDTSAMADFNVHPRGTSSHVQLINGRMSRKVVHTYLLIPRREGELTIPALVVEVEGKAYETSPITITVARDTGDGQGEADRDVYVTASVSEKNPFVGQQLIYTFSFFNAVQVTEARFQPPGFDGFNAREISERPSHRQTINGREFAVVDIRYVLVPVSPGAATIEPAVLQVGVVSRDGTRRQTPFDDFFDSPFLNRGSITPRILQTQAIELDVQPLPPFKGPGAYSGLVGRFDLSAAMENFRLQVGDSTTLTITIKGQGNIMDARLPAYDLPQGFKSYADTPQDNIQLGPEGFSGQKVFRLALVPVKAGKFELPPITLSYFDTAQRGYRTLRAALPTVYVTPAAQPESAPILVTPQHPGQTKETVAFTGRDILPLKEELDVIQTRQPLPLMTFILLLLGPMAAYGGLSFIWHVVRRDTGPAARMKAKAHQHLKKARGNLHDATHDAFLSDLYQALTAAILSAAGRSGEALTWKEAEILLTQNGLDQTTAHRTAQVLSAIESAKYSASGIDGDQAGGMFQEVRTLIRRLAP